LISFHLNNLLLRYKYNCLTHKVLGDNFNFWNYRALRQFVGWAASFDEKKDHTAFNFCQFLKGLILPYLATLQNPTRKHDLCEEISELYVAATFQEGVSAQTQHALMGELTSLISTLFEEEKLNKSAGQDPRSWMENSANAAQPACPNLNLKNKLLENLNFKAADSFRKKGLFDQEFAVATKYMGDVSN